jgi:hypothetical protein
MKLIVYVFDYMYENGCCLFQNHIHLPDYSIKKFKSQIKTLLQLPIKKIHIRF